jgi:hypothetical protein
MVANRRHCDPLNAESGCRVEKRSGNRGISDLGAERPALWRYRRMGITTYRVCATPGA